MNDYLTAEQIVAGTGRTINVVYKLANQHQWRRVRTRPRGYRTEDVLATLAELDSATSDPQSRS